MSNADDLRRLAEEVKSAYEARVNCISETKQKVAAVKQGTANLLDTFGKAHKEMANALRSDLSRFKSELDGAEKARKSADLAEISDRRDYITDLREKAQAMVDEFDAAHEKMAKALRSDLARIKPELVSAESERNAGVRAHIVAVQSEIKEMSSAWKELLTTMESVRGLTVITGTAEVAAGEVTKTAEGAVEELAEEEAEEEADEPSEEVEEEELLGDRIMEIVSDKPDGIKMTTIAEILGIENWRSLIPSMRELVDDGKLEKDGSLYFT
ncbi:MAG: hypothetical protein ACNYWU_00745 [Desulfobacterales bacterium]